MQSEEIFKGGLLFLGRFSFWFDKFWDDFMLEKQIECPSYIATPVQEDRVEILIKQVVLEWFFELCWENMVVVIQEGDDFQ